MSRVIGIDYGAKRTGLAVTDPLQIIVSGLTAVKTEDLLQYVLDYLGREQVEKIVFGYPVHKDGSKTYLCAAIDELITKLQEFQNDLVIERIDESFSSSEGQVLLLQSGKKKKKRQEKGQLDMYSAIVILRRYLGH